MLNRSEPRLQSFPFAGTCPADTSLRPDSVLYIVTSARSYFSFSKSFSVISFTDPHLLTSLEPCRFKNGAWRGHCRPSNSLAPNPLRFSPFADPHPLTPVISVFYKNDGGMGPVLEPTIEDRSLSLPFSATAFRGMTWTTNAPGALHAAQRTRPAESLQSE